MQPKVTTAETDLILHQCADLLRSHGFKCYRDNNKLAVEIQMCTLRGTYVTFTEHLTTIKEAHQIIHDYREGNYDVQHRRQG